MVWVSIMFFKLAEIHYVHYIQYFDCVYGGNLVV